MGILIYEKTECVIGGDGMAKKMKINKFDVWSVGKVAALVEGTIGLIIGAIITLVSLGGWMYGGYGMMGGGYGMMGWGIGGGRILFGVLAIILMPILHGVMGFIAGVVGSFFYNVVAMWVGGVELETT